MLSKLASVLDASNEVLKGKRTYICAALLFVTGGFYGIGVIDKETFESLSALFAAGSIAALRASK